jgi:hypothetical protein
VECHPADLPAIPENEETKGEAINEVTHTVISIEGGIISKGVRHLLGRDELPFLVAHALGHDFLAIQPVPPDDRESSEHALSYTSAEQFAAGVK